MLEKTLRMNLLFDFYQSLLTQKQRNYTSLYYLDDFSLGEIADEFEISRQAVYDNIRRTEAMLEDYEDKLKLHAKHEKRSDLLTQIRNAITEKATPEELMSMLDSLEKLN